MRILIQSKHTYPAANDGPGGGRVFDHLVKGLAQLGHEVIYYLQDKLQAPLPPGVVHTRKPCWDADIYHIRSDSTLVSEINRRRLPWVATCHTDPAVWGLPRHVATRNWISVSRTLAHTLNSERFVLNGIDPAELTYSEDKEAYLLFVSTLRLAWKKGLSEAIDFARASQRILYVAGSDPDIKLVKKVREQTERAGMRFLGAISGQQKAQFFSKAHAFLFPTGINEAFGLVIAEAMMSGTPVICSAQGACSELVTADVGYVCDKREQFLYAIEHASEISSQQCRARAIEKFHYSRMAREYVNEYKKEIIRFSTQYG